MSESYHKIPKDFVSKLFRRPTPTKLDSNVLQYLSERTLGGPNKKVRIKADLSTFAEDEFVQKINYDEKICEMPDNPRSTYLMVFSPDGSRVASTHGNHNIYVTDVRTGKNIKTLVGHPRTPWCITFHPTSNQIIASGCLGGEVRIWDLSGSSELWTTKNQSVIASIAFHPTERLLLIATANIIYFWDWRKPEPSFHIATNNPEEKIRYIAFDNLGQKLITGIAIDPQDKPVKVSFLRSPVRNENTQGTTNPVRVTYAQYVSNRDSNGTQVNNNTIANEATNRSRSFFTPRNEGSFLQLTREYEQLVRTYFRTSQTSPSSPASQTDRDRSDASSSTQDNTQTNSSENGDPQPSTSQNFSSSSLIVPSKLLMLKRAKDLKNSEHDYCKPSSSKLAKKETDPKSNSEPESYSTSGSSSENLSRKRMIHSTYLKQIIDKLPRIPTDTIVRGEKPESNRSGEQECLDSSSKDQKFETTTPSDDTPSDILSQPSCSNIRRTQKGLDGNTKRSSPVHERPNSPESFSKHKRLKTATDSENATNNNLINSSLQQSCSNRSIRNRPSAKVRMFDPKKYGSVSEGQSSFPLKGKTRSGASSSNLPGIDIKIHKKQPRKSVVGKALNNIQSILKTKKNTHNSSAGNWIEDTLRNAVNKANSILRKAGRSKNVNPKPEGSSDNLDILRDEVNSAEEILGRAERGTDVIPKPREGPCDSLDTAEDIVNSGNGALCSPSGSNSSSENSASQPKSSPSTKNNNQLCVVNNRVRFNFDMSKFNGGTYASLRLFPSTALLLLNSVHQEKILNSLDINNILDRIMNIFIDYKKSTSRQGQKNHKKFVIRPDLWLLQTASRAITNCSNSSNVAHSTSPRRIDSGGRRHIQRIREFVPKKIDYSELTVRNRRTTAGTIGSKRTEFNPGALKKILEELKNEMRATSSSALRSSVSSNNNSNESVALELNSQNGSRPLNRRSASSSENSRTVPASRDREAMGQTESRSSVNNADMDHSSTEFAAPLNTSRYLKEGVYEYAQIQLLKRLLAKSLKYIRFLEEYQIYSRSPTAQPMPSNGISNTSSPPLRTTRDFRAGMREEATASTSQIQTDSDGSATSPEDDSSSSSPHSRLDTASRRSFKLNRSHTGSAFTTYSARTRTKLVNLEYSLINPFSFSRLFRKLETLLTDQIQLHLRNTPHQKFMACRHIVGERLMAAKVQECVQRINRKFGTKVGNDLIGDNLSTDIVISAKRNCFCYNARYFLTQCAHNMSKHIAENAFYTLSQSVRKQVGVFLGTCLLLTDLLSVQIIDCVPPFNREEDRDSILSHVQDTCSTILRRRNLDGFSDELMRLIQDFHSNLENSSNNRSTNSDVYHHNPTTSSSSGSSSNSNRETTTAAASDINITNVGEHSSAAARTRPTTFAAAPVAANNPDNRSLTSNRINWRDLPAVLPRNELFSLLVQAMRRGRVFDAVGAGSRSSTTTAAAPALPSAATNTVDRARATFRLLHAWRENLPVALHPMLSPDALSNALGVSTQQFLDGDFGSSSSASVPSNNNNSGDGSPRNFESRNLGSSSIRSSTNNTTSSPHTARSNPNSNHNGNIESPVFYPLEQQRVRIIPTVRVNDRPVPHDLLSQHRLGTSSGHHTITNLEERLAQHRIAMRSRFLHPFYSIHTLSSQVDEQVREPPTVNTTTSTTTNNNNTINRDVHVVTSPATVTPNFRIQIWNMDGSVPDINDASKNVVVKECKIHNDASVDISKDGTILVTLLPSGGYLNVTNKLGVYSLKKESLGQCLYTTCLEQNAVSVAFSPQCRQLVVGLASRRVSVVPSERWIMARIFAINKKDPSSASSGITDINNSNLLILRELSQTRDNAAPRSVNCIRWLPTSGQGLIYGTNTGQLVILS